MHAQVRVAVQAIGEAKPDSVNLSMLQSKQTWLIKSVAWFTT